MPHACELPPDPVSGRELAAFVYAVDHGSVQSAADAMNLTQSATSKRLQALERRLRKRLLVRSGAGVAPTAAGRLLYPEAKEALRALARVGACLAGTESVPLLRLAASCTVAEFLLPSWLAEFRSAQAPMAVQIELLNSPGVLQALRDGPAEVGFVEGPEQLVGVESLSMVDDEIVVVVAPTHRWAARHGVRAHELLEEPYITREEGAGTRAVATASLSRVDVHLTPVLEVSSTQTIKRTVLTGGFALVSRLAIEDEVRSARLVALKVVDADLTRRLTAVRHAELARSPLASAWWRWLQAVGAAHHQAA